MSTNGTRRVVRAGLMAGLALGGWALEASAQCDLVVKESFRIGARYRGPGRTKDADVHSSLDGFWPELPVGRAWRTNDKNGLPGFAFAVSSWDPVEVDPNDPFNGTAYGEAGAVAVLELPAVNEAMTVSAEAVMGFGTTSTACVGPTSGPVLVNNLATVGSVWMSINGLGEWAIYANGSEVVAAGTAEMVGAWDSGWLHMEFTYDPVNGTVSGRVMNTEIPAVAVSVTNPASYVGIESHEGWTVLNNLVVRKSGGPTALAAASGDTCIGGSATFTGTTNVGSGPVTWLDAYQWPMTDGVRPDGSVVSGAKTASMTISNMSASELGGYRFATASTCGSAVSQPVSARVCAADVNCDQTVDLGDFFQFLNDFDQTLAGADITRDGEVDLGDFFAFLNAFDQSC